MNNSKGAHDLKIHKRFEDLKIEACQKKSLGTSYGRVRLEGKKTCDRVRWCKKSYEENFPRRKFDTD